MTHIETRDGTKLRVKVWGEGKPVVLIHGWPLTADSWDAQAYALAEAGHKVVSYDRRGFGQSDQPWHGYEYDTLTDDLADVMKATGVNAGATLVGFSMGGGEVARYMSRYKGEGVAKIALISSVVPYMLRTSDNPDGVPQSVFDDMTAGIKDDRPAFIQAFLNDFFGQGILVSSVSEAVLQWAWLMSMQAGLRPTLACAKAFSSTDFRSDLASITVPTLIVHGTSDKTVPIDPTARAVATAIARSKLIEYDGAPHGLFVTHQDRLTADLVAFLKQ